MRANVPEFRGVITARQLLASRAAGAGEGWRLDALPGRFVEISGGANTAALTCVATLLFEAQTRAEPVAWIAGRLSTFFPPDLADAGIDLAALPVVRARDSRQIVRAADHLLRSGGFGLVVLDLADAPPLPCAAQTRLAGLASHAHTALVCLTRKTPAAPSLGSLVSLRVDTAKARAKGDGFTCTYRVVKDKRRGPGWQQEEFRHGPDGLR